MIRMKNHKKVKQINKKTKVEWNKLKNKKKK